LHALISKIAEKIEKIHKNYHNQFIRLPNKYLNGFLKNKFEKILKIKLLNKFKTQKNMISDQNYIGRAKNSPKKPNFMLYFGIIQNNVYFGYGELSEIELTPLGSYARDYGIALK
jgi:hypothetical protein